MLQDIYNYLPIEDTLATAGQPTEEQFAEIGQAGFEVVVNLAMPTSDNALPDEGSVVEAQNMEYVAIPVIWESPTEEDFQQFQQVMTEGGDRKVFVHCAANMRVSAFIYLHRRLQGTPHSVAEQSLHTIWTPNATWQQFIDKILDRQ
ncbi:protein tyrosine phosphatase family protein [Oscillatoria sp. CS-180]|uniref:protein tyrosine phosphatase family protein n=1 Tax=Oscillatoria sp. CS-180 TaxID=3021720 RepID=UPI00232F8860|nr:protein tyrosine phosphatase family protein [Oscillatoria sp. CS-180]MDB9528958.1 protein tyrosine phosphatase family protein [Oscillatoria sp. CS-180]